VPSVPAKLVALEREVLKGALQLPETVGKDFDELGRGAFLAAVHQQLSEAIQRCGGATGAKSGAAWPQAVAQELPDGSEARAAVNALAVEPLRERPDRQERYASAVVTSLAEKVLSREIATLHSRMQRLTAVGDHDAAGEIAKQLTQLQTRHRELRALANGGE
jgi:DNA primase